MGDPKPWRDRDLLPCRFCQKPVFFAVTEKGRRLPLDPEPSMTGAFIVTEQLGAEPTCEPAPLPHAGPLFESHLVTCPKQDQKPTRKESRP